MNPDDRQMTAEEEVFEDLCEAETAADIFEAVERLDHSPKTMQSEVLVNAAGHMMGEALMNESRKNL